MLHYQESLPDFRFLRCIIAGEIYCVKMSWVRSIRNVNELQLDSESPQQVGWLPSETGLFPVININEHLNPSYKSNNTSNKVLVFSVSGGFLGILVEAVENIFAVSTDQILSLPHIIGGSALCYFDTVVKDKSKLILSLSPSAIYAKFYDNPTSLPYSKTIELSHNLANLSFASIKQKKIVIFTTNPEPSLLYGLSITQTPQVLRLSSVLSVPGAESFIAGIMEWRGAILPIVDLSLCIEKKKSDIGTDGRVLVVRLASIPLHIGIFIHPHVLIKNISSKQNIPRENTSLEVEAIHEKFTFEGKTLVIPNIDKAVMHDTIQHSNTN